MYAFAGVDNKCDITCACVYVCEKLLSGDKFSFKHSKSCSYALCDELREERSMLLVYYRWGKWGQYAMEVWKNSDKWL